MPPLLVCPAATHSQSVTHDTPASSRLDRAGRPAGVVAIDQEEPSQTAPWGRSPTSGHASGPRRCTSWRTEAIDAKEAGRPRSPTRSAHATSPRPSRSTVAPSVRPGFTPVVVAPDGLAEGCADTRHRVDRSLVTPVAADPFGLETIYQVDPFHCSARVDVRSPSDYSPWRHRRPSRCTTRRGGCWAVPVSAGTVYDRPRRPVPLLDQRVAHRPVLDARPPRSSCSDAGHAIELRAARRRRLGRAGVDQADPSHCSTTGVFPRLSRRPHRRTCPDARHPVQGGPR